MRTQAAWAIQVRAARPPWALAAAPALERPEAVRVPERPEAVGVPERPDAVRVPERPEAVPVTARPTEVPVPAQPAAVQCAFGLRAVRHHDRSGVVQPGEAPSNPLAGLPTAGTRPRLGGAVPVAALTRGLRPSSARTRCLGGSSAGRVEVRSYALTLMLAFFANAHCADEGCDRRCHPDECSIRVRVFLRKRSSGNAFATGYGNKAKQ